MPSSRPQAGHHPLQSQGQRDFGSSGPLRGLVSGPEADRTTADDLPQPQGPPQTSIAELAHGQSPGWQADPPFRGEAACHCVVQRGSAPWKSFRRSRTRFRGRPETVRLHRGIGVRLHPGTLFGIIPECRSAASRNRVHLAPHSPHDEAVLFSSWGAWQSAPESEQVTIQLTPQSA